MLPYKLYFTGRLNYFKIKYKQVLNRTCHIFVQSQGYKVLGLDVVREVPTPLNLSTNIGCPFICNLVELKMTKDLIECATCNRICFG